MHNVFLMGGSAVGAEGSGATRFFLELPSFLELLQLQGKGTVHGITRKITKCHLNFHILMPCKEGHQRLSCIQRATVIVTERGLRRCGYFNTAHTLTKRNKKKNPLGMC